MARRTYIENVNGYIVCADAVVVFGFGTIVWLNDMILA